MDLDYKKFCSKCGWNDLDFGCVCPNWEEIYQCPMYRHYHPEEVMQFERYVKDEDINISPLTTNSGVD